MSRPMPLDAPVTMAICFVLGLIPVFVIRIPEPACPIKSGKAAARELQTRLISTLMFPRVALE
jgi:hypothetical protein